MCFKCWHNTQTFHSFYKAIEKTHRHFFAKGIIPSKNSIDLLANFNQGEIDGWTQPIVLEATIRNVEIVLAEGDESCESEHFVACDAISITTNGLTNVNDHNVEINQKIDFATGTSTYIIYHII